MKTFLKYIFLTMTLLVGSLIYYSCTDFEKEYEGDLYTYPDITIDNFTPKSGRPNSNVTITGSNFGEYSDAAKVTFNGVQVTKFVSYADNQMIVKVPEDAGTGIVSVSVWTHTNEFSDEFTYIPGAKIFEVDVTRAQVGDTVTISGEQFGNDASIIGVTISGVEAEIVSVTDSEIKFKVPDASSGSIIVTVGGQEIESIFLLIGGELLNGTLIGHSGSWGNNPATFITAAVDGDFSTFVDGPSKTGFVGYDVGADQAANITSVRYVPRTSHPARMVGGEIRGANDPALLDAVTLYKITEEPPTEQWSEASIDTEESYRYIYYYSPDGFCNLSEIEFYGNYVASTIPEGMHNYEFYLNPRTVTLDAVDDWIGRDNQPGTTTVIEDGYCKVSFTPSDGTNKARADFNYSQGGKWGVLDKDPWVYHPDYPIYAIKIHFVQADGSLGGPRPAVGTVKYDRLGNFNDDYADQNVLWVDARGWSDVPKTEGSWWAVIIADILSDEQGYWVDWHRTFSSVEELEAFIGQ